MLSFIEPDSDDMFDAQITISELIDDYVKDEILKMSSPGFHNELVNQISDILFEEWTSAEICEDTDEIYDEICDFVVVVGVVVVVVVVVVKLHNPHDLRQ